MLTRLLLKAGSSPSKTGTEIQLSPVTIFVGPNNSGKSLALVEIENWVTKSQPPECKVVEKLEFQSWCVEEFESELAKIKVDPSNSETLNPDHVLVGKLRPQNNSAVRLQIHKSGLLSEAINPNQQY